MTWLFFQLLAFVLKLSYLNSMYLSVLNNFLVCYTVYTLCITLIVTCEVMIVLCLQHNVVCFLLEIITSITPWYVAFKTTILNSYVVFCGWFIITHLKHLLLLDTSGFLFFRWCSKHLLKLNSQFVAQTSPFQMIFGFTVSTLSLTSARIFET